MRTHVVALAMLVASTSAGVPTAAQACPYTTCPAPHLSIKTPDRVERGERARIVVRVLRNGDPTPQGRVILTLERAKGGLRWTDTQKYRGKRLVFRTPRLEQRGVHQVKALFNPKPGSGSKAMDNRAEFRVTRG